MLARTLRSLFSRGPRGKGRRLLGRKPVRLGFSGVVGSAAALAFGAAIVAATPAAVYPVCLDPYNYNQTFQDPHPPNLNYHYARVDTANGCTNPYNCNWVYITQGVKASLSRDGGPVAYDDTQQHVDLWVTAAEYDPHCRHAGSQQPGCWVQIGWTVGHSDGCTGQKIDKSVPTVYVEIYDDSNNPCYLAPYGNAPTAASYDARYYSDVGSLHRYHAFYQAPGGSIQDMAYGDFNDYNTASAIAGEGAAGPSGSICPLLGQNIVNNWNLIGYGTSPSTFASQASLYQNGSWHLWTTSVTGAGNTSVFPPGGSSSAEPYQISPTSNFTDTFTQWRTGGPNG